MAALAGVFIVIGLVAGGQMARICCRAKERGQADTNAKATARRRLLVYHGVVLGVCAGRAAVLLLLHALQQLPGLVLLLSQMPLFAESALFLHLAAGWVSAGVFVMHPDRQRRVRMASKLLITLTLLLLLLFPLLLSLDIPADRLAKAELAKFSALLSAGVAGALAVLVGASGCSVSASLKEVEKASGKSLTGPSPSKSGSKRSLLATKLLKASVAFGVSFFAQALLLVASVYHAGLLEELSDATVPLLHGLVEALALAQLLLLFAGV